MPARGRRIRCAALVCVALTGMTATAAARPLDEAACTVLRAEQARLEQSGTRTAMGKGPDWARSHASVALLNDIARLIEVDESVSFRCPRPKPVIEAKDDDEPEGEAKAASKDKVKDGKSAAVTPLAPKQKPAAPRAKPKPKPKVNDAHIPPPKRSPSTSAAQKPAPTPRPQPK